MRISTAISISLLFAASAFAQPGTFFSSNQAVNTPTDSPGAGTYSSTQTVTLSDPNADLIRYTTDSSTPSFTAGTLYTVGISVSSTTTVKAIGCDVDGRCGGVLTSVYVISAATPITVLQRCPSAGIKGPAGSASISCTFTGSNQPGSTIVVFGDDTVSGTTISDGVNSYTPISFTYGHNGGSSVWWPVWCASNISNSTLTITLTSTSSYIYFGAIELSGASCTVDTTLSTQSGGLTSGTFTTGTPGSIVFALAAGGNGGTTPTAGNIAGSLATLVGATNSGGENPGWEYIVTTSTVSGTAAFNSGGGVMYVIVFALKPATTTIIYLTTTGSQTWTVPSNWNSANNSIECIGGGGGGGDYARQAGAGGAYSKAVNVSLTPGATVNYFVAAGGTGQGSGGGHAASAGGDTYLCNSTSNCASLAGTAVICGAQGAQAGPGYASAASGGSASSGIGGTKYSGGNSGSTAYIANGGGGGAAGPNGNGGNGGNGASNPYTAGGGGGGNGGGAYGAAGTPTNGGNGGNNYLGAGGGTGSASGGGAGANGINGGGGGGAFDSGAAASGGNGVDLDASHGSGGGGASAGYCSGYAGGTAGLYGAGGGGACNGTGGNGAQGIIKVTYIH